MAGDLQSGVAHNAAAWKGQAVFLLPEFDETLYRSVFLCHDLMVPVSMESRGKRMEDHQDDEFGQGCKRFMDRYRRLKWANGMVVMPEQLQSPRAERRRRRPKLSPSPPLTGELLQPPGE